MNCQEIFNIATDGFRQIWAPAFVGLLLVALSGFCLTVMYRSRHVWFAWILIVVTTVLTAAAAIVPYVSYRKHCGLLARGEYDSVQGVVERFTPMPAGGHAPERFSVRGEEFSYTSYSATPFFQRTQTDGSPIRDGLYVRIAHVDGNILRLEICAAGPVQGRESQ